MREDQINHALGLGCLHTYRNQQSDSEDVHRTLNYSLAGMATFSKMHVFEPPPSIRP